MLNRCLFLFAIMGLTFTISAQELSVQEQIQITVDSFIEGMNQHDTLAVLKVIDPNIGLLTVFHDGNKNILAAETADMLIQTVTKKNKKKYREEQDQCSIETNGIIASAWCNYVFYQENNILHCGVNAYQLYKTKKGWKIIQITDSRKKVDCTPLIKE